MRDVGLRRLGNIYDVRLSRWGATNIGEYGEGPHSAPIAEYMFSTGESGGAVNQIDGVIASVSALAGDIGAMFAVSASVSVLSTLSGAAGVQRGIDGIIASVSGMVGAAGRTSAVNGQVDSVSGVSADVLAQYGLSGLVESVALLVGDLTHTPGTLQLSGIIEAVSRMFELFRYLNPVSADSAITQGASYGSDIFTAGAYASAMATAVDGGSDAATGETYLSIISTEVMA